MTETWREHLHEISDSVYEIKQHGKMRTNARFVSDKNHLALNADGRSLQQLVNTATMPGIVGDAWAMADWHFGYGFPIGGVVATDASEGANGVISPGGVGFDINCGVRMLALDFSADDIPNLKRLGGRLSGRIPAGASGKGGVEINAKQLDSILLNGMESVVDLGYGVDDDLNYIESQGYLETSQDAVSNRAKERGLKAMGTLGSGNHFMELQSVENLVDDQTAKGWGLFEGQLVAMIHSGSRGLGHQVCSEHSRLLERKLKKSENGWYSEKWDYEIPDRQLACAPIYSKEGQDYLNAMNAAANFAFANRSTLATRLREVLKIELNEDIEVRTLYDVSHNIAKIENHHIDGKSCKCCVHRKGATRSFPGDSPELNQIFRKTGQPVLVPGDMGNGSWIMSGPKSGMTDAFGSSCHGAGRALSRSQAKKQIDGRALKQSLEDKGIRIHAKTPNILSEEAPDAYKNVDSVTELTQRAGLARKVARLSPIAVIKG